MTTTRRVYGSRHGARALWLFVCIGAAWPLRGTAVAADAGAAEPPSVVGVEDVLQLLYERNPALAARRMDLDIAASDLLAAGLLPNPTIEYGGLVAVTGPNTIDGSQHSVTVEQPLLLAGQRGARRAVAGARQESVAAEIDGFAAELAYEARQKFAALLAAQARVERLEEVRVRLAEVERIVSGRAQAGTMSRYDQARVEVERAALDSKITEAQTERAAAALELAMAVGIPGWQPQARGRFAPGEIVADAELLWPDARATLPQLEVARRGEVAAMHAVELARRERWPVPALTAGPFMNTKPESWAAIIGVSVPLPTFDRGQAALQRAVAETGAAALQHLAATKAARSTLERATTTLARRRAGLAAFEENVVGRLGDLFRMAEEAYRSGQGGILDLLDVVRTHSELQLDHVERIAGVLEAEIDTLAAAGRVGDLAAGGAVSDVR